MKRNLDLMPSMFIGGAERSLVGVVVLRFEFMIDMMWTCFYSGMKENF